MLTVPPRSHKFVVTGASGFIGRQLVPRLRDAGCNLLLVGRNTEVLQSRFPGLACCTYDKVPDYAQGFDTLVHLAVLNNDTEASPEDFDRVNVGLLSEVLTQAKAANIARFVNVTTFHALSSKESAYAQSKRKALEVVDATSGIAVTNLFLPAVFGDAFAGKLLPVSRLPGFLRGVALTFLSALAPTVHVDRIARFLADDNVGPDRDVFLANPQDENTVFRIGKRLIDLLFVISILGLFWWLLLIVWILIPLDSPGRGIFEQTRIGKGGKHFTVYKFRTMKRGTRQAGTHEMTADSVTRMGSFLRKTKLDELSQVFNIIRGDLSLVGPRPCLPVQTQLIEEREKRGVFTVRPGITGLAQINNVDMSDPVKLARWDARYVAQRSLPSELKIAFLTFLGRGHGDKISS
jgi:lipopolysaccharide/colanic/teichoic acid biosynthesis glycosyltransferase